MLKRTFAEKLKDYRKELELKRGEKVGQVKLAKELGLTKGNIGDYEIGARMPSKKVLTKLVEHSGKSIDYWLDGVNEYDAPETVGLMLDKMIQVGLITDLSLNDEVWEILKKAVLLELERKLT